LSDGRFELVEVDLRNAELAPLLDGIDVVFHLAAQPGVRASWSDGFPSYVEHNIVATQRLLEASRQRPLHRFTFTSSSSVYGNAVCYPTAEDDVPHPHSPYGVTKLAAEHLCGLYAEHYGIPTVILRYFTVYGPRQRPDMGFSRFLDAAVSRRPLPLYGDGEQVRDFTYVSDVVGATISAADTDVPGGSVFNVSGGSEISINSMIGLISDVVGYGVDVERLPQQPGDVRRTSGCNNRARAVLGWEPRVALRDGVEAQFDWMRTRLETNNDRR
jgi:nucleoside-diphosphate-sugar epimerase